ncbi:MAG: hypothetical protein A2033_01555 [Bacteroidetes bacterium GWA2_31_9]|nr:MAG: hypothetical protein A2033_01555 [Bacteroidetes bacterium GWA2_31_9]
MKHKKLKFTALFLYLGVVGLQAQETIPVTGGEASGTGGTASYSLGQVVYTTNTGTNGSVSQGVQQPYEISTTIGIDVTNINLEFSIYPNPTVDFLTLKVDNVDTSTLSYQLFDMDGKLLEKNKLSSNITSIKLEELPKSTYLLNVTNNQKTVKTFKIIKK